MINKYTGETSTPLSDILIIRPCRALIEYNKYSIIFKRRGRYCIAFDLFRGSVSAQFELYIEKLVRFFQLQVMLAVLLEFTWSYYFYLLLLVSHNVLITSFDLLSTTPTHNFYTCSSVDLSLCRRVCEDCWRLHFIRGMIDSLVHQTHH